MKLKMAPNSLFAILLRKPWWVSIALVGVIALAARALVPQGTHPTPRAWHRRCKRRVLCRGGIFQV